jgi:hypothetical protein
VIARLFIEHREVVYAVGWLSLMAAAGTWYVWSRRNKADLDAFGEGLRDAFAGMTPTERADFEAAIDYPKANMPPWPPMGTHEPQPSAELVDDGYLTRCTACGGAADPSERSHQRGGPTPGSSLTETGGCGAAFIHWREAHHGEFRAVA